MPAVYLEWTVLPHKPIEKLTENLWTVEGMMANGKTQRRMVVARLRDGRLVIHNAIALDDNEMKELDAFGQVAAIVVPNGYHRQDSKIFKDRYPSAKVYCPKGATKRVAAVVPVDGDYASAPQDADVRIFHLEGVKAAEGVIEVKSQDGASLVFNDVVLNMKKLSGMSGIFLQPTGRPSVPRIMRFFAMKDRGALSTHLNQLATTPGLKRILVGHGKTIVESASDALSAVARELKG